MRFTTVDSKLAQLDTDIKVVSEPVDPLPFLRHNGIKYQARVNARSNAVAALVRIFRGDIERRGARAKPSLSPHPPSFSLSQRARKGREYHLYAVPTFFRRNFIPPV